MTVDASATGSTWLNADWDILLTLGLPESLAPDEKKSRNSQAYKRASSKQSIVKLRKGLQLEPPTASDAASKDETLLSDAWLIREVRERVLRAGLCCNVLKLTPNPDDHEELPGEHEVDSGHNVTIVCIGAKKEIGGVGIPTDRAHPQPPPWVLSPGHGDNGAGLQTTQPNALPTPMVLPPPTPPPTPPPANGSPKSRRPILRESTSTRRLRNERFPRLEEAAESAELRLRTNGAGPRVPFRAANAEHFPPFRSKLRQQILEHILRLPLSDGGAGLNLDELVASGRVREVVYVHDDDECTDVKKRLVYGVAGICPLREQTSDTVFEYSGGDLSFYFAFIAAYTRSLHAPALVGLILWLLDASHFDAALVAERNATRLAHAGVLADFEASLTSGGASSYSSASCRSAALDDALHAASAESARRRRRGRHTRVADRRVHAAGRPLVRWLWRVVEAPAGGPSASEARRRAGRAASSGQPLLPRPAKGRLLHA